MSKLIIFEPAMCCPTGVCGPSVDTELLRITGVITSLNKRENLIERFNLKDHPMKFVEYGFVSSLIKEEGIEVLPLAVFDGQVITKGGYPTNEQIEDLLNTKITEEKSSFKMV
jgi:hypothetical protein